MDDPVFSSQDVQSVLSTDVAVRHVGIIDHQARQIVIWIQDVWVFRNFWQTGSLQAPIDREQTLLVEVRREKSQSARGFDFLLCFQGIDFVWKFSPLVINNDQIRHVSNVGYRDLLRDISLSFPGGEFLEDGCSSKQLVKIRVPTCQHR